MTAQQICSGNGDRAYFYDYDNIGNNICVTAPSGVQTANMITALENLNGTQTVNSYVYGYSVDGN